MKKVSWMSGLAGTLMLAAAGTAFAQGQPPAQRKATEIRHTDPLYRAYQLRPQRRDEPLRYLNISDDEVREIQLVAEKYIPNVLLNISPVVAGCACEEGPQCTDQVYIVAESGQSSKGLQLSRIRNSWVVGSVQQWFLRHDELRSRAAKMDYPKFLGELNELLREFPSCVGELVPADATTASTPKVQAKQ